MQVLEATVRYLEDNSTRLRTPATRQSYRKQLASLNSHTGSKPVQSYKTQDVVDWCGSGDPSPNTVAQRVKVAKSFFGWATDTGLVKQDPTENLKRYVGTRPKNVTQGQWLTKEQVASVLDACGDGDGLARRNRLALTLGFHTGLRATEICGLQWGDVHLGSDPKLSVRGKGEKPAVVGVSRQLGAELQGWSEERSEAILEGSEGPVVPRGRRGFDGVAVEWPQPLGYDGLRGLVAQAGERVGLSGLSPHDMRRSLAGILDERGVPWEQISQVLRHESVATTQRYLEKNPRRAVQTLQEFEL